MGLRLRWLISVVCALAALGIATPARANTCSDAQAALDKARQELASALSAMQTADSLNSAAKANLGGVFAPPAQQNVDAATNAWLEANKNYLKARNAVDDCQKPKVEPTGGFQSTPSAGTKGTFGAKVQQPVTTFGSAGPGRKTIGFGSNASGAFAAGQNPAFGGVRLAVVGDVNFNEAFGTTTPAFLGGVRGTVLLNQSPQVQPFAEVLFGIEHCGGCGTNSFATEFGFGMLYQHWAGFGIVGELSFRHVSESETETRIVGGVSFTLFGAR